MMEKNNKELRNLFSIEVINGRTGTFRVWNYGELKKDISIWQIFRNIQYRWDLNN